MESRQRGNTQKTAAAQAGFCERTARDVEKQHYPTNIDGKRWRTRRDPFETVWEKDIVPLIQMSPKLEAKTLLEELQRLYPDQYPDSLLRSMQRKVKHWKAISGAAKEVIFRQVHSPGVQSISDFTNANELDITIRGESFSHLLYHFRLTYSGWAFVHVIHGGESYPALAEGIQNAFWELGGVTQEHRTDSLSAAYKNLPNKAKEEFTKNYTEFCNHYGITPTRNNKGVAHENGAIESPNGHLKRRLKQALLLRGSTEFDSEGDYKALVREVVQKGNRRIDKTVIEEMAFLKPLPKYKACEYTEDRARVTRDSMIRIKQVAYSVPSRLIGELLKVHIYDDRLECYLGGDPIITLKRVRRNKVRVHHVDYRHVIGALAQKPQAFRRYVFREALFPTPAFRQAWQMLDNRLDSRESCREYVKILAEAAQDNNAELMINDYLESCHKENRVPGSQEVKRLLGKQINQVPLVRVAEPRMSDYQELLSCSLRGAA